MFSSEEYGAELAPRFGAVNVPVDPAIEACEGLDWWFADPLKPR